VREPWDWKFWFNTGTAFTVGGGLAMIVTAIIGSTQDTPPNVTVLWIGGVCIAVGVACYLAAFMMSPVGRRASQWFWRAVLPARKPAFKWFELPPDTGCEDSGAAIIAAFSTTREKRRGIKIENAALYGLPEILPKPIRLVFLYPKGRGTVRESDLPATVRARRGDVRVTHFINGGFVLDEGRSVGDGFNVEIYFDADTLAGTRKEEARLAFLGSTQDPLLATVNAALNEHDRKVAKLQETANKNVPLTPMEPRIAALEKLLSDGELLDQQAKTTREDAFPHFPQGMVNEAAAWHRRVSGALFPWRKFQWFDRVTWIVREPAHGPMEDITLADSIGYLRKAIDEIKGYPPLVADVQLLMRLRTAGQHIQTTLESGYKTWNDSEFLLTVGNWWNEAFDALLPWPMEQRTFPHLAVKKEAGDQFDLTRSLQFLQEFIDRLEGK